MTTAPSDRRAIITEALHKIDELSARLEIAEKGDAEPIAVVGMGCRFPGGVNNPDQYWRFLREGRSGIVRVPPERWDADALYSEDHTVPGTICTREGGFLTSWKPDEFDAEFFSIAPREAAAMDPQQRLTLEVAWEALEDAGLTPQAILPHLRGQVTARRCRRVRRVRECIELRRRAIGLFPGSARPCAGHRHRVFVVIGGGASGLPKPASTGK